MGEIKSYIVSYDIMDAKRLHTVHKTMKGFGDPIHYSVFRCNLSEKGKIKPRRVTGNCTQHQKIVAKAVKNAREMALVPYTSRQGEVK